MSTNSLIAWSYDVSGAADVWIGTMGAAVTGGPAATLTLASGNGQSGTAGQPLSSPFVVKVTDGSGNPVAGTTVTFTVTGGGGTIYPGAASTNSQGLASATLTLGPAAGTNTVVAASGTLTGSPSTLTAIGIAASGSGPAATLVSVSGSGQSGIVGQPLSSPFVVKVTDASGNPVAGIGVTFTMAAGGGTVNPTATSTNSQGLASTTLTLGSLAGANAVVATSGTLAGSPITFTATGAAAVGLTCSLYDLNGDGLVNAADVQIAINQALGISPYSNGDVNHDGACNVVDVQLVINAATTTCVSWAASAASASAVFVKADTTTAGSWIGVYGADGHQRRR